jgi:hypothetical protein
VALPVFEVEVGAELVEAPGDRAFVDQAGHLLVDAVVDVVDVHGLHLYQVVLGQVVQEELVARLELWVRGRYMSFSIFPRRGPC